MELSWWSAIIGVLILALCFMPFWVMHMKNKKREGDMLNYLKELSNQHSGNIHSYEFCGDFAIGVDLNNRKLYFIKQLQNELLKQTVSMADVQTCRYLKHTRSVDGESGKMNVTEAIELQFLPKGNSAQEQKFRLYSEDVNNQLSGELQFAEKWSKQINDWLKA